VSQCPTVPVTSHNAYPCSLHLVVVVVVVLVVVVEVVAMVVIAMVIAMAGPPQFVIPYPSYLVLLIQQIPPQVTRPAVCRGWATPVPPPSCTG
jgi:hypothetical protein